MTVEIEIIDRVYHNMEDFCNLNGFDIKEYMSNAVTERYNLDKYGDLNEKLVKKDENKSIIRQTKKEEPVIETSHVEIAEEKKEEKLTEEPKQMESVSIIVTDEKPKKTRRTLKAK